MIQIRPVSDLRNKFPEIEMFVNAEQPVYLTKNGYGTMVVLSLEKYASLVDNVEMELDEADEIAETTEERLSHDDVEAVISERLNSPLAFEHHPSVKKRKTSLLPDLYPKLCGCGRCNGGPEISLWS